MADTQSERIRSVDVLRTLGIAGALAVHLISAGFATADLGVVQRAWFHFARNGSYGVTVFFVVSGFIITSNVLKQAANGRFNVRDFYVRRVGRIFPLAAAVLAFGALMLSTLHDSPARTFVFHDTGQFDGWFYASFPTFTFNWVRVFDQPMFGIHWDVFWSLAIEEQFYLLFPLLFAAAGTTRRMIVAMFALIIVGIGYRAVAHVAKPDDFLFGFCSSFSCFDLLAIGVLTAIYNDRFGGANRKAVAGCAVMIGSALLIGAWTFTNLSESSDRMYGPSLIGLGAALVIMGSLRLPGLQARIPRLVTLPGQLSYGMYLLHATALFLLWDVLAVRRSSFAFVIFFATTTAIAYIVFRFYEAPANKAIRKVLLSTRQRSDALISSRISSVERTSPNVR